MAGAATRRARWRARRAATLLATSLSLLVGCATPPPADLTPPTVVSHTPTDGDDNVSVHDIISVRFSEPLAPASVTDVTVQLAGTGSVDLAKTLSLSDDGVLVVAPVAALTLPQTVVLDLSAGVLDRAGNPLEPYSYGWTVPSWLRLGPDPVHEYSGTTFIYSPLLAVDSRGSPVVANNREAGPQARLRRWDSEQWQEVPLPPAAEDAIFVTDMAFDQQDRLVLVWEGRMQAGEDSAFHVSRLDGTSWTELGSGLLHDASYFPSDAAVAIRSDGNPVIAWAEKSSPGNSDSDQYVRRWDGTNWQPIGGKLDVVDGNVVQDIDLVLSPSGAPIVAWGDSFTPAASQVRTYDPTLVSWQSLGTAPATSGSPQLVVTSSGGLVAAIAQATGVRLYRFDGDDWLPLGAPVLRQAGATASRPTAQATGSDTVMVAWSEFLNQTSQVNVAEMTEEGWRFHGDPITIAAGSSFLTPSLALLEDDVPALAVGTYEPPGGSDPFLSRTLFRRLNR